MQPTGTAVKLRTWRTYVARIHTQKNPCLTDDRSKQLLRPEQADGRTTDAQTLQHVWMGRCGSSGSSGRKVSWEANFPLRLSLGSDIVWLTGFVLRHLFHLCAEESINYLPRWSHASSVLKDSSLALFPSYYYCSVRKVRNTLTGILHVLMAYGMYLWSCNFY